MALHAMESGREYLSHAANPQTAKPTPHYEANATGPTRTCAIMAFILFMGSLANEKGRATRDVSPVGSV